MSITPSIHNEAAATRYRRQAADFLQQATRLRKRYVRFAIVRLLVFLIALFTGIYLGTAIHPLAAFLFAVLALVGFYRLVQWHTGLEREEAQQRRLARVNEEELEALQYRYRHFPNGARFLDINHPYSVDLDIFGEHSFFQYTNRCTSVGGEECLAGYFTQAAAPALVMQRQEAIAELRDNLAWRQAFRATGLATDDQPIYRQQILTWLRDTGFVWSKPWMRMVLWLLPIATLTGLATTVYLRLPWLATLACLLPAALLLMRYAERIQQAHTQTGKAADLLHHYTYLLQLLEKTTFQAPWLQAIQLPLLANQQTSARALQQLAYYCQQLDVRYNAFAIILNLLGLWDLQWLYRLEGWRERWREHLPQWFNSLAEMEALCSLANLAYNNPDWCFPEFNESPLLESTQLGHPLINPGRRIGNDLTMPTRGHLKLITGSNMAGKSTFLRAVGLNIVLAQSGAPVCARSLRLPPLQIITSMRTADNLAESASSFYAELQRLKLVIDAAASTPLQDTPTKGSVFFLLDEILKGTNSRDRHRGNKALIKQLLAEKSAGLLATHDLELTQMEAESDGHIENLCMEVTIHGSELAFDYRLRKGVSQSFNATLLMEKMGIVMDPEPEDNPQ
ncbi:MAG: hypothetical protein H6555_09505 [Lewinellaceae bacterium]|nr:hypothetical protein [Lewinellaceae bacterium]